MKIKKLIKQYSRALFTAIFLLSAVLFFMPNPPHPAVFSWSDKAVHSVIFFILSSFAFISFPRRTFRVFLLLVFYMVAVETIQELFIPGRGYEFLDLVAGFSGTILGFLLFKSSNRKSEMKKKVRNKVIKK